MAKLVRCIIGEKELTTVKTVDGSFRAVKGGDIVEVDDSFESPIFEEYKKPQQRSTKSKQTKAKE